MIVAGRRWKLHHAFVHEFWTTHKGLDRYLHMNINALATTMLIPKFVAIYHLFSRQVNKNSNWVGLESNNISNFCLGFKIFLLSFQFLVIPKYSSPTETLCNAQHTIVSKKMLSHSLGKTKVIRALTWNTKSRKEKKIYQTHFQKPTFYTSCFHFQNFSCNWNESWISIFVQENVE